MKKVLFTIAFVFIASTSFSAPTIMCEDMAKLATSVAEAKYANIPKRAIAEASKASWYQSLVDSAYNLPPYASKDRQREAIREFSNMIFYACRTAD